MKTSKNIFFNCEEANYSCDKSQYNEASFWEKIKLNIHLLYCRACRAYTKNNNKLSRLIRNKSVEILPTSDKEKLQNAFQKELNSHK